MPNVPCPPVVSTVVRASIVHAVVHRHSPVRFSCRSRRPSVETNRFVHRQGRLCETPINPCAINPCQNNGLCSATFSGYQCQCSIYYTGALCEITLNPCDYSPCRNGATCRFVGNTTVFNCACAPGRSDQNPQLLILRFILLGFTGQFCDSQINYCASQPCLNNGICVNTALGFQCLCPVAFTGPTCSILINPCLSQPCVPSNTLNCTSNTSSYTCFCRVGFTGELKAMRTQLE